MQIVYEQIDSLPRLAWCARLTRGRSEVRVWHGPWVERFADGFCEGAWDGPFADGAFDEAATFTGTGGRLRGEGVVFATATNSQERLHFLRRGDALFVSNSLTFALVVGGDAPDPGFHLYESEYLIQSRLGIFRTRRSLPTRRGEVVVHECANLRVTPDLDVERIEKNASACPRDYATYVAIVQNGMRGVFENAADPRRGQGFRPLATLSAGYDSPALAVLGKALGCNEAATFSEDEIGVPDAKDDGSPIGELLGLDVKTYARKARPSRRPCPEAEFCVCPPGGDRTWLAAEDDLEGRVFVTGRHGDIVLSPKVKAHSYNLARSPMDDLGGSTMNEYRLRVGYMNFAPWFTGWQHMDAIRRISLSEDLRPWSIGGPYDRPIPRRILEEAGIPRALFGQTKLGGAYEFIEGVDDLSDPSRTDFERFFSEQSIPRFTRLRARLLKQLERAERRIHRSLYERIGARLELRRLVPAHYRISLRRGYLFHWGFARVAPRYRPAAVPPDPGG